MFSELKDNKSVPRELLLKGFDVDQIWEQIAILQKEYAKIYKPKLKAFKELDDKMEKDFEEEMNAKEELESSIPISKKRKLDEDSIENSEDESNGSEDEDEDEDDGGIDIHGELDDEEKKLEKALDDYEAGVAKDDASNEEEFNEDEDEEDKDDGKEKSKDTPSEAHPKELAKDADDLDMEEVEKMADELEAIPDDSLDGLNDDEDEDDDQDIDTLIKKSKKLKDNDIMYNDFFEEDKKGDDDSGDEDIGLHGKSDDEEEKDLDKALDDYEAGIAEDDATHEDEEEDLDNEEGLMDEDEDKEDEEPEAAPTPEAITAFKKSEIEIHRRIAELEERLVGDQHWSMIGEVSGAERPENSLLETGLEYDAAVSAPPTITEEATKSLEDIIIKRIKDGVFDDVVKKEPPKPMKEKKTIVLNDEKSKEGLADLYARDYQEQLTGVKQEDDKLDKNKKEIMKLFNKITHDLDVLSNFHYVPKLVFPPFFPLHFFFFFLYNYYYNNYIYFQIHYFFIFDILIIFTFKNILTYAIITRSQGFKYSHNIHTCSSTTTPPPVSSHPRVHAARGDADGAAPHRRAEPRGRRPARRVGSRPSRTRGDLRKKEGERAEEQGRNNTAGEKEEEEGQQAHQAEREEAIRARHEAPRKVQPCNGQQVREGETRSAVEELAEIWRHQDGGQHEGQRIVQVERLLLKDLVSKGRKQKNCQGEGNARHLKQCWC